MKNLSLFLILFFSAAVLTASEKSVTTETSKAPAQAEEQTTPSTDHKTNGNELLGKASPFRKEILSRINEIIADIETNYPSAIGKYSSDDVEKTIKALVSSLNYGIEYFSSKDAASALQDKDKKDSAPCPSIIISSQKVLYARIDEFNPASFAKLKDDCENTAKLANKPVGLIIDIRDCQGFDYESCIKSLALFCPTEKILKIGNLEIPKRALNIPVIILVGSKTRGAAEIFARLMLENGQCLLLGSATSGYPFFKKKTVLKSGGCLMIPSVPKFLTGIQAAPLAPTINVDAYPQIPYEKLSATAGSEESDQCLQRATDLLISLDAIHKDQQSRAYEKIKSK